jgi:hypothetical protein
MPALPAAAGAAPKRPLFHSPLRHGPLAWIPGLRAPTYCPPAAPHPHTPPGPNPRPHPFTQGGVPAAGKLKKGEGYAEVGSITSVPTSKDYAAFRAFTTKDKDYATTQAEVKEVVRAINVGL